MERAALYIRVSTDDQTEYSPAAQKNVLLDYAKKHGLMVLDEHIFADEGYSGRTAEKRPAFMKMIALAKGKVKPFDVILVHKFDRFARSREISVMYKAKLKRDCGIKVISITESLEDEKMSVIIEPLLEGMAEYYSINLGEEVKKGMTEKAKRGEFQSSPPFGYTMNEQNHLCVVEEEAKHVTYIFDQFVNHHKGCFTIARDLNLMGVKSKRGNSMDNRGVQYILCNPIYAGMVRWTPTAKIKRNFNHPDSIIEMGSHQPIISKECFEQARQKMMQSRFQPNPNSRPLHECKHWLSGLVKCSDCGATLTLSTKLKYPSFQCSKYSKGQCNISHSVTVKKLEEAVLNELNHLQKNMDDQGFYIHTPSTHHNQHQMDALKKQLDGLKAQGERASKAYLNEVYSLEEYRRIKKELEKEMLAIQAAIHQLQTTQPETMASGFQHKLCHVVELLTSDYDMETKQSAVRAIIDKMVYDKANAHLDVYYNST